MTEGWATYDNRNLDPGGGQEVRPWKVGDVITVFGVLATVLADRPGFVLMDGTVVLPGGVTTPDLRDKVIVGAGTTYAMGTTGGAVSASLTHDNQGAHQHDTKDLSHAHTMVTAPGLGFVGGGSTPPVASPTNVTTLTHALHNADGGHVHTAHTASTLQPYAALYILIYTGNV